MPHIPYAAVPRALEADERVNDAAVRLYGVMTRYANQRGEAWPSQQTLAEDMRRTVRTVERAVRELAQTGWITVVRRRPGGPNLYRLHKAPEAREPAAVRRAPTPPEHRALIPPDKNVGTHPTKVSAHSDRYIENEENLASRGATLDEDVERSSGSDFDPEFIAGFQDGRESGPAAKTTGARALAMELRSDWMAHGPDPVAGDINVAAVAGQIASWRRSGVTIDEIRAMITLFVSARGYHIPGAPPWKAFLTRRKALLEAVRKTSQALAAENDPDYWREPVYDEKAEADAWYAAQFAGYRGA